MMDAILLTAACTITALVIGFVACFVNAPLGYQDSRGFHYGTPDDHPVPLPDEGR